MKKYFKLFFFSVLAMLLIGLFAYADAATPSEYAAVSMAGLPAIFLFFDITTVASKTTMSTTGGGYTSFRFAPKDYFDVIPLPDGTNPAKTLNDFVFKAGKEWIYLYTDDTEFDFNEEPTENKNSNGYTSTLTGFLPGENSYIREMINSDTINIEGYALLDNCKEISTLLFGKGKCCAATLKLKFMSGKKTSDPKGWEFTLTIEQDGVCTHYEGVGAMNETFTFAANDATPDVSHGTATYLIPANTAATEITDLDNAVAGSLITLKGTSATNPSTITNGGVFQLTDDITLSTGVIIVLQATTASSFAERYRYVPTP